MATRLENFAYLKKGLNILLTMQNHGLKELQYYALSLLSGTLEPQPTGYFQLPTAFGKTHLLAALAKAYQAQPQSEKIVIVVPTIDLIEQTCEKLKQDIDFTDIGAFYAHAKDTQNKIIVTTYNSLEKLGEKVPDIGLILLDEAHHILSDKRQALFKTHFQNACLYGMTATPVYSSDKNLSYFLDEPIVNLGIKECIHAGILCSVNNILLESKFQLDLSQVKKSSSGDWDEKLYHKALIKATGRNNQAAIDEAFRLNGQGAWEVAHRLICDEITDFYLNFADPNTLEKIYGKPCLINCRTQREAEIQALALNEKAGKKIAGVWTTDNQSVGTVEAFKKGKFPILCQVGKLNEGFDFPKLSLCINYPTSSFITEHQRSGRVLRIDPDNPMKKALVVDIVFAHPNATNHGAFASAKLNQQVLFSDVIQNTELVTLPRRAYELKLRKQTTSQILPSLTLANFNIYATPQKLLELRNEGLKWIHEIKLPTKRAGMYTPYSLQKRLHLKTQDDIKILESKFQEIFDKHITFTDIDGIEKPLIEYCKSANGVTRLYLHESLKALQEFVNRYAKELNIPDYQYQQIINNQKLPLKRKGMLSASEMSVKLCRSDYSRFFSQKFQEIFDQHITFTDIDGIEKPLIEYCKSANGVTRLYLHESLKALQKFVNQYGKELNIPDYKCQQIVNNQKLPLKREGMLSPYEISVKLSHSGRFSSFKQKFQEIFDKHITFTDIDGIEKQMIERCIPANGTTRLYLHESPKALQEFVKRYTKELNITDYKYQQIINNQKIPLKREGMLSVSKIYLKLRQQCRSKSITQKFQEAFNQGITFTDIDGIEKPLIEYCRSTFRMTLYLHESPKALQAFMNRYGKELNISPQKMRILNNQKTLKRKGMLSASATYAKLGCLCSCISITQKFQEAFNQGITFTDIDNIEKPLIECCISTNGSTRLYLHESLKALQAFINRYGKELNIPDYKSQRIINNQKLPLKRKGMLSASEMSVKLSYPSYSRFFSQKFQEIFDQHITFTDIDGIEKLMIEHCKSTRKATLYLHESPKALQVFMNRYGKELNIPDYKRQRIINNQKLPLKRKGMLSASETFLKLKQPCSSKFITQKFQEIFDKHITFTDIDGIEKPMIEYCKSARKIILYLHESPKALQAFVNRYAKELNISTQKMKIISNKKHLNPHLTLSTRQHDR